MTNSRALFEPYGLRVSGSSNQGPGYTGHVQDVATGLNYMQQRYYDPVAGRFLSPDPLPADPASGSNFNRYWYANNNPYKFVDPDGRSSIQGFSQDWKTIYVASQGRMARDEAESAGTKATADAYKAGGKAVVAAAVPMGECIVNGCSAGQALYEAATSIPVAKPLKAIKAAMGARETVRVGELIATHGRTMSNRQFDQLVSSVRAEGINQPLTVTEQRGMLFILDGHHRALAAPRAGVLEVPINRVELPFGAYQTVDDLTFMPGGY